MRRFKNVLRLVGLAILIIFASIGVGLNSGAPIPKAVRRENLIELNIESDEEDEEEINSVQFRKK